MSRLNLISKKDIKNIFREYRIYPTKRLGQNFLISKSVLKKIIEAAEIKSNETILEIGPGIGVLTIELTKKAKNVIAIEKDYRLIEILKKNIRGIKNVQILEGDVMKSQLPKIRNYKIVANIPYYLTSPLIRKILESKNQPKMVLLMVQKEVAQRICSKPPEMNLLAVSVQFYSKPEIISYVSKKSFWPQPKVDSAILQIISTLNIEKVSVSINLFFRIVKAGFSQPRKQLANNLSKELKLSKEETKKWLLKNGIEPNQRAESLGLEDWMKLTKSYIIR